MKKEGLRRKDKHVQPSARIQNSDKMTGKLKHDRWLTGRELLVHELHMQVEHLLLGFTLQQLQLLPPTHHVTQIPHLQNEGKKTKRSNTAH